MEYIKHLSDKPWSDYTKADYSIEQWHNACLIHQHEGPSTSKEQCKLPVKTPTGAINRNGVHAAAAALAGARGGVHASSAEKSSAAKALIRYYHMMEEDPPPSLLNHSAVVSFIEHHGVKGMKWGVRNRGRSSKSKASKAKTAHLNKMSDEELRKTIERMRMHQEYKKLSKSGTGKQYAQSLLEGAGKTAVGVVAGAVATYAVKQALDKVTKK